MNILEWARRILLKPRESFLLDPENRKLGSGGVAGLGWIGHGPNVDY
jgi:hypothetical protein